MQLTSTSERDPARASAGARAELQLVDVSLERTDDRGTPLQVLDNVSFDVRPQEFVTVMGPSGCGKSTLLEILAGFLAPTHGEALYQQDRISGPSPERGVVFQSPALYPWLTVLDNVLFGPRATGRREGAEERARSLLAEVGLKGFEDMRPYELSGGMRHRAALARTLANEPPVLLMDEPFGALDAQIRTEMQRLLLSVWERHRATVVFVTHDIEEGLLLADRTVILTGRPARVRAIVEVSAPRPRGYDLVFTPEFVRLREEVRELLHQGEHGR
jgi:NitT/TauT family transport system ATP-binding protein